MQEEQFKLKTILDTLTKVKNNSVKKRLIYDRSSIGGIARVWLILLLLLLPLLLAAAIFNPSAFSSLGIARAIVFFIVFLSVIMLMVFGIFFLNNNKSVKQITPSWKHYFPGVDLKMVLASGITPYKDFFKYYGESLNSGTKEKELHQALQENFHKMQEENSDFLERVHSRR